MDNQTTVLNIKGWRVTKTNKQISCGVECIEKWWHSNDQVSRVIPWLNGKKHGIEETYNAKGKKLTSTEWKQGIKDGIEELWTESSEGVGQKICYWKSHVIPWKNGKRQGVEEGFWYNEAVSLQIHWDLDQQHGPANYFFIDSSKHIESTWDRGIRVQNEYFSYPSSVLRRKNRVGMIGDDE
jgi:antitoxin component YwqK of YwqJK toxin-antitoxin module